MLYNVRGCHDHNPFYIIYRFIVNPNIVYVSLRTCKLMGKKIFSYARKTLLSTVSKMAASIFLPYSVAYSSEDVGFQNCNSSKTRVPTTLMLYRQQSSSAYGTRSGKKGPTRVTVHRPQPPPPDGHQEPCGDEKVPEQVPISSVTVCQNTNTSFGI